MKEDDLFYMIRVYFPIRDLFRMRERRFFSRTPVDTGYLVHSALKELFGKHAPSPFAIMENNDKGLEVLSYADCSHERLRDYIRESSPDYLKKSIHQGLILSKKMPEVFPRGQSFNYRVRLCPVIRKARGSGPKAGSEMDVFLTEVEKNRKGAGLNREEIYKEWFEKTIRRKECAECQTVRIAGMKLDKFIRRDRERKAKTVLRPNVVFEGIWTVTKPDSFRDLIRRGIGRHKAFGFGMVLLKLVDQ